MIKARKSKSKAKDFHREYGKKHNPVHKMSDAVVLQPRPSMTVPPRTVYDARFDWWDTGTQKTRSVHVTGMASVKEAVELLETKALTQGWQKPTWLTHLWRDTVEEGAQVVTRTTTTE